METCVLIPHEFSLAITTNIDSRDDDITVWTMTEVSKGRLFYPFQGTIRTDKLDKFNYLKTNDIRYRFGLYDEVSNIHDQQVRYCNWIRFIRISNIYDSKVNMVCTKVKGEPMYETIKLIAQNQELLVYILPQSREEQISTEMRSSLYRQTMDLIVQDIPLDLSKNLLHNNMFALYSVANSDDDHGSLSSDSSGSSLLLQKNIGNFVSNKINFNRVQTQALNKPKRVSKSERSYLPCSYCGKCFDRPSLLKRHMRTHTGEKPHVCMVCGKGFSTSSSLNTHRRIHSGEKPHECQICGKRFTASSNLYYHRMTHVKEKPHKCSLCAKSFSTPGDLKSHMYVHSGSWPFKCQICFRGFSKQTNLKNHIFLHTGTKPHKCELCNRKFALSCNLRAHMKTHEDLLGKNSFGKLIEDDINNFIEYES